MGYEYFVSVYIITNNGPIFVNLPYTTNREILDYNGIEIMEAELIKQINYTTEMETYIQTIAIINFKLLNYK